MSIEPKSSLPNRDNVTALQISNLLQIAGMMNMLIHVSSADDDEGQVRKNDGGARMAAENTLVGVCARLDSIIEDTSRWTLDNQAGLEAKLREVYEAHIKLLGVQHTTTAALNLPSRRCSPTLLHLDDGRWAAILGDFNKPNQSIIGLGNSPEEALHDFDMIFIGKSENATILPTTNENLDQRTEPTVDNPSPLGEEQSGDSSAPGQG